MKSASFKSDLTTVETSTERRTNHAKSVSSRAQQTKSPVDPLERPVPLPTNVVTCAHILLLAQSPQPTRPCLETDFRLLGSPALPTQSNMRCDATRPSKELFDAPFRLTETISTRVSDISSLKPSNFPCRRSLQIAFLLLIVVIIQELKSSALEGNLSNKCSATSAMNSQTSLVRNPPGQQSEARNGQSNDPGNQSPKAQQTQHHFIAPDTDFKGSVQRQVWRNCKGNSIDDLHAYILAHPQADETLQLHSLATPADEDDNYGQRISGYLHPPESGGYKFRLRANAAGSLRIQLSEKSDDLTNIKTGSTIHLEARKPYFFEAFHKESTGRDYFNISWNLPSGAEENPIPAQRISIDPHYIPPHRKDFVVLTPQAAKAGRSQLTILESGDVLVEGDARHETIYRLEFQPPMSGITAFRLEVKANQTLPAGGPGWGISGRFSIAELGLRLESKGGVTKTRPIKISTAHSFEDRTASYLIDGRKNSAWSGRGKGKTRIVDLRLETPLDVDATHQLRLLLLNRNNVGCFRFLATSATKPDRLQPEHPASDHKNKKTPIRLHVNLGGKDYLDANGIVWVASSKFTNQSFGHEGGQAVTFDSAPNHLMGSAQRSIRSFRAMVPNGRYEVTLFFCEYWTKNPESRIFSILVEQQTKLANFALLKQAGGRGRPFILPLGMTKVTDERLDIEFETQGTTTALLNAIKIVAIQ